ncbi:MAG: hypothetical protein M1821_003068 [Bathelium mastoideum]|nr:MAG: hypothetical protein M1821_003068 [Bathelium mastoideum]
MPGSSSSSTQHARAAHVDDYDSDESKVIPETTKTANVATRRASQATQPVNKPRTKTGPDTASDSGYSSRTAATMNSADSAKELRGESPAKKKESKKEKKVLVRSPPASNDARNRSSKDVAARPGRSPTKAPSKSASQNRKSQHVRCPGCDDPNCPDARPKQASSLDSALDVDYPPFNESSQNFYRYPMRQPAMMTTGQARPRASSTSRARPQSFYEGAAPETYYHAYRGELHGPPPSQSAWTNVRQPYPYMGSTPPNPTFLPSGASAVQSSTVHTRPPPQGGSRERSYSARRPSSGVFDASPIITYGQPSSINGPSARRADPRPSQYSRGDTEIGVYEDDEAVLDRQRMPPPANIPTRTSSLRRAPHTAPVAPRISDYASTPVAEPFVNYDEDAFFPEEPQINTLRRTSSSRRRPSLPRSKATSYTNSGSSTHITTLEGPTYNRRRSYIGPSSTSYDAANAAIAGEDPFTDDRRASQPRPRARRTESASSAAAQPREMYEFDDRRQQAIVDDRAYAAERYQEATKRSAGNAAAQAPPQSLRPPPIQRTPSKAGSERSGVSSSRASVQPDGSIRFRVDTSRGIEFSGDIEGRTINLVGGEGGMADVVIGAAGSARETVYSSVGGGGSRSGDGGRAGGSRAGGSSTGGSSAGGRGQAMSGGGMRRGPRREE